MFKEVGVISFVIRAVLVPVVVLVDVFDNVVLCVGSTPPSNKPLPIIPTFINAVEAPPTPEK